jgi:hypothetical protein
MRFSVGDAPLVNARIEAAVYVIATVQETAVQWDLQQRAVRSMKWVYDLSNLESTTWRWWPQIFPRWNPLTSWMRQIEAFQRSA